MGRLMGSSNSNNYGEQIFINKASEYLDDTNIIYWNRQLFGKEFDVCILMPEKGILVVELKGWREENILRIENNDSVIIQTNDGEVSASPQKQARGYRFSIERHIRQNISKFPLVYQMVCLPQVSKAFFKSHRLDVVMEEKFTILKTTHPFSISWIPHSVRFVIGTETHLTGEPCWRSVTCLRQISMLTKMANPKLKKNLPRPIIGMTIRAFTISTNSIRCPAIPSTIW